MMTKGDAAMNSKLRMRSCQRRKPGDASWRTAFTNLSVLGVLCGSTLASAPASRADETTFVHELARNRPRALIIASGAQAAELGNALQTTILQDPVIKFGRGEKQPLDKAPLLSLQA